MIDQPTTDVSTPGRFRGRTLYASSAAESLLAAGGLTSLARVLVGGDTLRGRHEFLGSRHDSRRVTRRRLAWQNESQLVYIKAQWRRERFLPRVTDLREGTAFLPLPVREWRGLWMLKSAGFHVSEPLALFTARWPSVAAAIVTRAVPVEHSLEDLALAGELAKMPGEVQMSLAEAVGEVIRRIHSHGWAWRSPKPKHFYPQMQPDGNWRIWLIDCEGLQAHPLPRHMQRDRRIALDALSKIKPPPEFLKHVNDTINNR